MNNEAETGGSGMKRKNEKEEREGRMKGKDETEA